MKVNIVKLYEDVKTPTYATDGSGCFDLYSRVDGYLEKGYPGKIPLGIKIEVPKDHVLLLFSRSGHGFNNDVRLSNCVGVIDSDYRGEIMVKLTADGGSFYIKKDDRIVQGLIIPIPKVEFNVVDALSETKRGEGGFGSTG